MNLPTLSQLAREQASFVRYQDGKLWYQVIWDDDGTPRLFNFPIPTDNPLLEDAVSEVQDAIHVAYAPYTTMRTLDDAHQLLSVAMTATDACCAGGGEFLSQDKGIRFMKWMRMHLDFLRASGADMEPT